MHAKFVYFAGGITLLLLVSLSLKVNNFCNSSTVSILQHERPVTGNGVGWINHFASVHKGVVAHFPSTVERPMDKCVNVRGNRIVATFSSVNYEKVQEKACEEALNSNTTGIDVCFTFNQSFIDAEFRKRNERIFNENRGAGLWLWKPYILLKILLAMDETDVLLYQDVDWLLAGSIEKHICLQVNLIQHNSV